MFERYLIEMGKAVARDIVGKENFPKLEEEINQITNQINDLEDFPTLNRILNCTVIFFNADQVVPGSNSTLKKWGLEYLRDVSLVNQIKSITNENNARNALNKLKELKENKLLKLVIARLIFSSSEEGLCYICGKTGKMKIPSFVFKLSNPTDYTEFGHFSKVCPQCNFWLYLSNFYPQLSNNNKGILWLNPKAKNNKNKKKIYYKLLSEDDNPKKPLLFHNNFIRYIRDVLISYNSKDIIVFYTIGSQSSNISVLGYGMFNISSTLEKMITHGKINEVNNFNNIFLYGQIPQDDNLGPTYIPIFTSMLQNDWIPTEMFRYFLEVFRNNAFSNKPKDKKKIVNIQNNFRGFYYFCEAYSEVKNMEEKNVLNRGFRVGRSIRNSIDESKDEEQLLKWLSAKSGIMEMSAKEFIRGILEVERRFDVSVYTNELDEIAKDERKRLLFLTGLLSGAMSISKDNDKTNSEGGDVNAQKERE